MDKQLELFSESITDLSKEIDSYTAEHDYLKNILLKPNSRDHTGFPIGSIDKILEKSRAPFYTICPNPFIGDWFQKSNTVTSFESDNYQRQPYSTDVSEGKNDKIYNLHTYHTKVPHKAILQYILHYTEPGDTVFDGFCGTGMTGIASQLAGDKKEVTSLGLKVNANNEVIDSSNQIVSRLGARNAILSDLSPSATFIAYNYNNNLKNLREFALEATAKINELEERISWVYSHDGASVTNAVWSDVFICPNCSREIIYFNVAQGETGLDKTFNCPHCRTLVGKSASKKSGALKLERATITRMDPVLKELVTLPKFILVRQSIKVGKKRKQVSSSFDESESFHLEYDKVNWPPVPKDKFMPGRQTNKLINGSGISHICHMYTIRALYVYSHLWDMQFSTKEKTLLFQFCLTAINNYISRKQGYYGGGGGVAGTLFTPSIHLERNVFDVLRRKIQNLSKLQYEFSQNVMISTQSATDLKNIPDNSIDYIFTDPPFGESLQYSELNSFTEAWLGLRTDSEQDCVLNYVHKKDLNFYSELMKQSFMEFARILKPGRWMTIEFHNSQNSVWTSIQQAVETAGLLVADVRILDKKQKSFNAVNNAGAVNRDLIISAYKPKVEFEQLFATVQGQEQGAMEFTKEYLSILPIAPTTVSGKIEIVSERTKFLLFDRMVAYHLKRGARIPVSANEYYQTLDKHFVERDGMYFLPDQAAKYDAQRARLEIEQLTLFIVDERSAVNWIRNQILNCPQTLGDLTPKYLQETKDWDKNEERFELRDLLKENFICDDSELWRLPNPNIEKDLEELRKKSLIKIFNEYIKTRSNLKVYRKEAIIEGFKYCWQSKQYAVIVYLCEKLPKKSLLETPEFIQFYDIVKDLTKEAPKQVEFIW